MLDLEVESGELSTALCDKNFTSTKVPVHFSNSGVFGNSIRDSCTITHSNSVTEDKAKQHRDSFTINVYLLL